MKKSLKIITICMLAILCSISFVIFTSCNKVDPTYIDESKLYYDSSSYYGLYFYGPNHSLENEDMIRSSKDMSTEYFDPNKPTLIWIHGWEPTYSYTDKTLSTSSDMQAKAGVDYKESYVVSLKEKYNVATFQYQTLVDGNASGIAANLFTIYSNTFINAEKTGYSMGYMFASELCLNLGGSYNQEIVYVGHSCGAFVTTAVNYYIQYFLNNKIVNNRNLLASRMALVDPYFNSLYEDQVGKTIYFTGEKINSKKTLHLVSLVNSLVQDKDVAVDIYLAMSMASGSIYNGSGLTEEEYNALSSNSSIVYMEGLRKKYGDTNIHVLARDWFFMSANTNKVLDNEGNAGPSLALSTSEIKALRGKQYKQTLQNIDPSSDSFTLVDTLYAR